MATFEELEAKVSELEGRIVKLEELVLEGSEGSGFGDIPQGAE